MIKLDPLNQYQLPYYIPLTSTYTDEDAVPAAFLALQIYSPLSETLTLSIMRILLSPFLVMLAFLPLKSVFIVHLICDVGSLGLQVRLSLSPSSFLLYDSAKITTVGFSVDQMQYFACFDL